MKNKRFGRVALIGAAAVLLAWLSPIAPAQARVFIGIGFGFPRFGFAAPPPVWYRPPPPVWYRPAPVFYRPPPVWYRPPPPRVVYVPPPPPPVVTYRHKVVHHKVHHVRHCTCSS